MSSFKLERFALSKRESRFKVVRSFGIASVNTESRVRLASLLLRLQTTKQVVNRRQVQALPRSPLLSLLRVQAVACIVLEGLRKSR
jgi:hypothetical protein